MAIELSVGAVIYYGQHGTYFGQTTILTSYWRIASFGGGLSVDFEALIAAWHTASGAIGELNSTYTEATVTTLINIRDVFQPIYPIRYIQFSMPAVFISGQVEAVGLPPNVSGAVTLRTDQAGPTQRGTKRIGAVPTSFTDEGMVTAMGLDAYDAVGESLSNPWTITVAGQPVNLEPIIWHREVPVNSPVITNHIVGTTTRVDRRRTVGLGI